MKKTTIKSLKTLAAVLLLSGALAFNTSAQTSSANSSIVSEIKVKETSKGNAFVELTVNNKATSPFLVLIRDYGGSIIFKEWAKGESYKKRFKLDLVESDEYSFEVMQDKKLVDTKSFKVAHRTEETIEILAVNRN